MIFDNEQDKQIVKQALLSVQIQGKDAKTIATLIEKIDQSQIGNATEKLIYSEK